MAVVNISSSRVNSPRNCAVDEKAEATPDPQELEDPAFEALWAHVLAHWDDDKAHAAFLEHCQEQDRLLAAAKRYRGLKGSPQHDAQAERRLAAVAILAMARLDRSRTNTQGAKRQAGRLVALLFLVAAVTGLLIFYSLR
jgi:hypothetical protein